MRFAASPQVASFLNQGMNFGDLHQAGQKTQAEQRITATQADAAVAAADLEAEAMIEAAKETGAATRAQGAAQGQSAMWGGISSGIGSLAGGFAGMNSNGATGIDKNFSGLTGDQWNGSISSFGAPAGYTPYSSSYSGLF